MKRAFLTILAGFAAGIALRPVIERHGPGWREMCERMCSSTGCECGTKADDEEKEPLVTEEAA